MNTNPLAYTTRCGIELPSRLAGFDHESDCEECQVKMFNQEAARCEYAAAAIRAAGEESDEAAESLKVAETFARAFRLAASPKPA